MNSTNTTVMRPSQVVKFLELAFAAKEPVMLHGTSGTGKSSIVAQTADNLGIGLIDIRLSQYDFIELRGMPFVNTKDKSTEWVAPSILPREGKGILFLDELNSAQTATMAAAYQLINDRAMGEYQLPEGWSIVAAGNLSTEGAITNTMPTPLRNRMAHVELSCSPEDWLNWAYKADIHHSVISFIKNRPSLLNELQESNDSVSFKNNPYNAFATPRTWHKVSNMMHTYLESSGSTDTADIVNVAKFAHTHVGTHAAFEFDAHCKYFDIMPDLQAILKAPSTFDLNKKTKETPVQIAIAVGLVALANDSNTKNFMKCISKLDKEIEVMAVHDLFIRSPAFQTKSDLTKWLIDNAKYME